LTVNVVHCCPEGAPENVFRQLASPPSISGSASSTILSSPLLEAGGWVAVYGPYLADDGTYKSPGDEEVSPPSPLHEVSLKCSSTELTFEQRILDWV
jgi:hypothetical protein